MNPLNDLRNWTQMQMNPSSIDIDIGLLSYEKRRIRRSSVLSWRSAA